MKFGGGGGGGNFEGKKREVLLPGFQLTGFVKRSASRN